MRLDHVGFLVTNLIQAARHLAAAGFTLTPPARLHDSADRWTGGAQQVARFIEGYIEVQELQVKDQGHVLERLRDEIPTAAVIAYGCDDVHRETDALRAIGIEMSVVSVWSRETPVGRARFAFSTVRSDQGPARVLVQHLTPRLTLSPGAHPNGVTALTGVVRGGGEWEPAHSLLDTRAVTEVRLTAAPGSPDGVGTDFSGLERVLGARIVLEER